MRASSGKMFFAWGASLSIEIAFPLQKTDQPLQLIINQKCTDRTQELKDDISNWRKCTTMSDKACCRSKSRTTTGAISPNHPTKSTKLNLLVWAYNDNLTFHTQKKQRWWDSYFYKAVKWSNYALNWLFLNIVSSAKKISRHLIQVWHNCYCFLRVTWVSPCVLNWKVLLKLLVLFKHYGRILSAIRLLFGRLRASQSENDVTSQKMYAVLNKLTLKPWRPMHHWSLQVQCDCRSVICDGNSVSIKRGATCTSWKPEHRPFTDTLRPTLAQNFHSSC